MPFAKLGLAPQIVRALEENGYKEPSPIQQQAIPMILEGQDLIACAQTGTGKTAAFSLPLINRIAKSNEQWRKIKVLILSPTRELASQIHANIEKYSKYVPVRSTVVYGGVSMNEQLRNLRNGVHILVATPGRLIDHMRQRTVDFSEIETLVLDEADNMLDMGFVKDVRRIVSALPRGKRQSLLFSATFSDEIRSLSREFLNNPKVIQIAKENAPIEVIEQTVYPVDRSRKRSLLSKLITDENWQQVLVFTRTKHGANRLAEQLEKDGHKAMAIHGNKSQSARTRALDAFKAEKITVLVATDIAARGIDISELPQVVNFDLPQVAENYVHRIGRTGRAGCTGKAVSLVSVDDEPLLRSIERLIRFKIETKIIEGFKPDPTIQPEARRDHLRRSPKHKSRSSSPRPSSRGGQRNKPNGSSSSPRSFSKNASSPDKARNRRA